MDDASPTAARRDARASDARPAEAAPGMTRRPRAAAPDAPVADGPERPTWPAIRRGLALRCPHCGEGRLFEGYLKVADHCPACGAEMRHHRADDGPAYVVILLVGHIVGFAMHAAWVTFRPEPLLFATVTTVLAVSLSLFLLPRVKGAIVGVQWARRMHGFGGA